MRPAAGADRAACARIYLETRRACFFWLDGAALRLGEFDASVAGETLWVAERNGAVAGFASVWEPETFLHNLFVAPAAQGRGLGGALLSRVEAAAGGRTLRLKCDAANGHAMAFYRRRGWRIEERGVQDGRGYLLMRAPSRPVRA